MNGWKSREHCLNYCSSYKMKTMAGKWEGLIQETFANAEEMKLRRMIKMTMYKVGFNTESNELSNYPYVFFFHRENVE